MQSPLRALLYGIDPLGEVERTLMAVLAAVAGVRMLLAGTSIRV
jgi:hypothetical protein